MFSVSCIQRFFYSHEHDQFESQTRSKEWRNSYCKASDWMTSTKRSKLINVLVSSRSPTQRQMQHHTNLNKLFSCFLTSAAFGSVVKYILKTTKIIILAFCATKLKQEPPLTMRTKSTKECFQTPLCQLWHIYINVGQLRFFMRGMLSQDPSRLNAWYCNVWAVGLFWITNNTVMFVEGEKNLR